eukprot:scaffold1277_cov253-Pinguiococcus_pyrenoidosus.AAC.9
MSRMRRGSDAFPNAIPHIPDLAVGAQPVWSLGHGNQAPVIITSTCSRSLRSLRCGPEFQRRPSIFQTWGREVYCNQVLSARAVDKVLHHRGYDLVLRVCPATCPVATIRRYELRLQRMSRSTATKRSSCHLFCGTMSNWKTLGRASSEGLKNWSVPPAGELAQTKDPSCELPGRHTIFRKALRSMASGGEARFRN